MNVWTSSVFKEGSAKLHQDPAHLALFGSNQASHIYAFGRQWGGEEDKTVLAANLGSAASWLFEV